MHGLEVEGLIELGNIVFLRERYRSRAVSVSEIAQEVLHRCEACPDPAVWIDPPRRDRLMRDAGSLDARWDAMESLPLFGVPFAVKDNIDVAGVPTTAGCPGYAYMPAHHAAVVQRLIDAGALYVGKTNLDQFATGLVGTRSPYGAPRCVFNQSVISGGSSSGSAVAVARGLVSFALGTDTAGSGRVPAALNGIVGLKPSLGRLSCTGVVPACRSLDCASVFTCDVTSAARVLRVVEGFDERDPYSRPFDHASADEPAAGLRLGVPALKAQVDHGCRDLFEASLRHWKHLGCELIEIDATPFLSVAELLYGGPWVAERYAAVGSFIDDQPMACDPTVRAIIGGGRSLTAASVFRAMDELRVLRRRCERVWDHCKALLFPTCVAAPTVEAVRRDPVGINSLLGRFTNFMNLLDLCGLALPAGHWASGAGFGVTLVGRAGEDERLLSLGGAYHQAYQREAVVPPMDAWKTRRREVELAVFGAHLSGMPLHAELTERHARLAWSGTTAGVYRLYAMPADAKGLRKPALVRDEQSNRSGAIACEVWSMSEEAFGSFVALVPPPLAIGSVERSDGRWVKGFVCEPRAVDGAEEVTAWGGWRAYVESLGV